jgi:hypothetical protein
MRVEAARAPFHVLHGDVVDSALAGADAADEAEPFRAAEDLALDEQTLLAVGVDDHLRRALAIGRIDVLLPDVDRLEDVTVGVDDVVRARHEKPPWLRKTIRSSTAER